MRFAFGIGTHFNAFQKKKSPQAKPVISLVRNVSQGHNTDAKPRQPLGGQRGFDKWFMNLLFAGHKS